jgi:hypothetical protein
MASAIATTKEMMSIYSHPRVEGATWHQFLHASTVSKERKSPLSRWGVQSIFITESGRYITTPPSEAVKMFIQFAKGAKLVPEKLSLPKGIHCLCANAENGKRHFVVNSTATEFVFPVKPIGKRSSLFADSVTATSIRKYGTYGDNEDEVKEIKPRDFNDFILPPYSISILRSPFDSTRQSANKPPARTASVQ